jgi:general secretion pathway protein D
MQFGSAEPPAVLDRSDSGTHVRVLQTKAHLLCRQTRSTGRGGFVRSLLVAAALVLCAPSAAEVRAADDSVTLNFVNADIDAVVKAVAEITGRNFIVDPKVKGTVNIVSSRPVPRSLVYPTLLSALRLQGYAAVEGEGVVKIVPEAEAKQQGGAVVAGRVTAGGDQLVTQVVTLRYETAAQLVNVLRPLITPNNTITAYPNANALVITDYADNLKRIDRIIASLDQPPGSEPVVVPLRYASALDLVSLVNRLVAEAPPVGAPGAAADAQQRVTVIADPRSNSVLIRADNPGRVARVRQLIEQLDTPGRPGGNMFIVYLKNAEAARVAQTLRAMLTGESGNATLPPPGFTSATTLTAGMNAPATPVAAPPVATPVAGAATQSFATAGVTITADTANNALVIMAPEPVYNNLRAIIQKLDVRRAQVFVEGLICEVSADKAAEFGIQWQALSGYNTTQTRVIGGTNFTQRGSGNNIIDVAINPGSVGQGLALGVMKGTVTIPGLGTITNLAFLARALETEVGANILSTPTLLTLDNEEARILVGQNIPLLTGSYATTGSSTTVTPFQTFERKDIGLMLRVKPQITEGGTVRLLVYQEVSRIDPTLSTAQSVVLSKRVLESSVVIDDSQIVVLGGLIDDQFTSGSDSVPLLGQIPIAGALFRYDARHRVKTNLLVFLKPTVVRTTADGRSLTSERYDFLMGEQLRTEPPERVFWRDSSPPPVLPPEGVMPGTPQAAVPVMPQPVVPPPPGPGTVPAAEPAPTRP